MNVQNLMDAMEYLDDDLLTQTDRRRRYKRRKLWLIPTAAAACLCLFLIGLPSAMNKDAESAQLESPMEAPIANDCVSSHSSNLYGDAEIPEHQQESPPVGCYIANIQITEISEEGFSGMLLSEDGHELHVNVVCVDTVLKDIQIGMTYEMEYTILSEFTVKASSLELVDSP